MSNDVTFVILLVPFLALDSDAARLQQELEVTRNTEMSYAELYESAKASRQRVEGISVNLEASVFSLEGEVARLEEELREARERMTAARALLAAARAEADDVYNHYCVSIVLLLRMA